MERQRDIICFFFFQFIYEGISYLTENDEIRLRRNLSDGVLIRACQRDVSFRDEDLVSFSIPLSLSFSLSVVLSLSLTLYTFSLSLSLLSFHFLSLSTLSHFLSIPFSLLLSLSHFLSLSLSVSLNLYFSPLSLSLSLSNLDSSLPTISFLSR